MKPKVAIIDYGLGNIFSIKNACEIVGLDTLITSNADEINNSDALILPGVGAFGDAINSLKQKGLDVVINNFVNTGKPFLGICLGMQLMFTESEEFGVHKGLGLISGKIIKFPNRDNQNKILKVPQIQWNQIYKYNTENWENSPMYNINEGEYVHFVHSYYAIPDQIESILSYSEYGGIKYASSVIKDNLLGIQFHPEKSGIIGIEIYKRWAYYILNKSYK
jgi:glutamine amidotransferase